MGSIIVIAVVVVLLGVAAASNAANAKVNISPETLDLDSVRDALMEKQGWSRERADAARQEYIRFLTLLQIKPKFILVPWLNAEGHDDLDQFWHQHILDTAKYAADCDRLFGRMIHHNPHLALGSAEESEAVEKTRRLYGRTFGSDTDGSALDVAFLASCGADVSSDHHGHTDTGHGDAGHSDGGHSCGGHSCGGAQLWPRLRRTLIPINLALIRPFHRNPKILRLLLR